VWVCGDIENGGMDVGERTEIRVCMENGGLSVGNGGMGVHVVGKMPEWRQG